MISLLDVNVLVALAWPNHVHHSAAWDWFGDHRKQGWATCILTEAGFVRVSCAPAVVRHEVTPLDALAVLGKLVELSSHTFWPLDRSIMRLPKSISSRLHGHRQITDAVLLAAAKRWGGRLVTLDAGMRGLAAKSERRFLVVIPV